MRLIERLSNLFSVGRDGSLELSTHEPSTRIPPDSVEFALVAEEGVLAKQAVLLCDSLRRFSGRYAGSRITVVSPRRERRPCAETIYRLRSLGADYLELDVQSIAPEYGATFKMYAAAAVENRSTSEFILFMDSDILFSAEPELDLRGAAVAVRPVDIKGMCTEGRFDSRDRYWQRLCEVNGVDYESLPFVESTVDKVKVRASYNGGFVLVRRSAGVLARTLTYFERSVIAGLAPWRGENLRVRAGHGLVSAKGSELWGSSQACLSLAIWGSGLSARILPVSHNFPLHTFRELDRRERNVPLRVIHYHHLFEEHPKDNPLLNGKANVTPAFREWVRNAAVSMR